MRSRLLALLVVLVAACGGQDEQKVRSPTVQIVRFAEGTKLEAEGVARVDFGEVSAGRQARANLVLENLSGRPLELEIATPDAPFSLVDAPDSIAPRSLASLVVRFTPEEEGEASQDLVIRAGGKRLTARLRGRSGPVGKDCEFTLDPPVLRLTAGSGDPGLPWEIPIGVEVRKGRCGFEAMRVEGELGIEMDAVDNTVFLEGTRTELVLRIDGVEKGREGSFFLRLDGREVELPVRVEEQATCVVPSVSRLDLVAGLHCENTGEVLFLGNCDEAPALLNARIWPESETARFGIHSIEEGSLGIQFTAHEPLHVSDALGVFDFANGDRVYVRLTGRADIAEQRFTVPQRRLDLLVLVDKSTTAAGFAGRLDDLAAGLWTFVSDSPWETEVAVTTTAREDVLDEDPECPAENGRLLPLEGSRPRIVGAATPDGKEVLRQNLEPAFCAEEGKSRGLDVLVSTVPWTPRTSLKMALILAAEDDASWDPEWDRYVSRIDETGLRRLDVIGPCNAAPRYRQVAQGLGGRCRDLTELDPLTPTLSGIDEDMRVPELYTLDRQAETFGDYYLDEEHDVFVFVNGEPLPSHGGEVGWVLIAGWTLRMNWGLEPGTEVRIVYPPLGSTCAPGVP